MRKLIILTFLALILSVILSGSSNGDYEYTLKYTVYYSKDRVVDYTRTNNKGFAWGSSRGTNWVKDGPNDTSPVNIIRTSATIEIKSYTKRKLLSK